MGKGLDIDGVIYKHDDSDVTWDDFVEMVEGSGMYFGGITATVDEYGERIMEDVRIDTYEPEEPEEPEKPVIPQFVAEWIKEEKRHGDLWDTITDMNMRESSEELSEKVSNWLYAESVSVVDMEERQELITRAWLDGYEVEKEPLYYAKIKGWELFVDFVGAKYWGVTKPHKRIGFVGKDDAVAMKVEDWNSLGITEENAEFVEVGE